MPKVIRSYHLVLYLIVIVLISGMYSESITAQSSYYGMVVYDFNINLNNINLYREATLEFSADKTIFYHSRGEGWIMVDLYGNIGDITMEVTTTGKIDGASLDGFMQDSTGNTYFFDYNTDTLIVREFVFLKPFLYKESIPLLSWKITDERKFIQNYVCYKAMVDFRGRSYTAWFTPEIPVHYGPWKLHGLPGLIIEIKDDKNEVFFEARKINIGKNKQLISNLAPPSDGHEITFEKSKTIYNEENRRWFRLLNSRTNRDDITQRSIKKLNLLEKFNDQN